MAAKRPFWKWRHWKSIGSCLWPPSTCRWNLKLKFQSKLDLCSRNHVVYRQTDGQTDGQGESSIPPSNFVGRGYNNQPMWSNFQSNTIPYRGLGYWDYGSIKAVSFLTLDWMEKSQVKNWSDHTICSDQIIPARIGPRNLDAIFKLHCNNE